jgi:hypothetical protein
VTSGRSGRDALLFLCVVLFGFIWWHVPHSKTNWLPTFIVLILLAVVTAAYAMFVSGIGTGSRMIGRWYSSTHLVPQYPSVEVPDARVLDRLRGGILVSS